MHFKIKYIFFFMLLYWYLFITIIIFFKFSNHLLKISCLLSKQNFNYRIHKIFLPNKHFKQLVYSNLKFLIVYSSFALQNAFHSSSGEMFPYLIRHSCLYVNICTHN